MVFTPTKRTPWASSARCSISSSDRQFSREAPRRTSCHQLDYATSGVMLYALSKKTAAAAQQLFEKRRTQKQYAALIWGHVAEDLRCDEPVCTTPASMMLFYCCNAHNVAVFGCNVTLCRSGPIERVQDDVR